MLEVPIEFIGDIHVSVYKTDEGYKLFNIQADTQEVLPVRYVIEDTLTIY